ncbi:phospholipase A2-like [Diaphorina citri]|uniref:Phospholipase A2 n=1 Tax=Diaphorina citri TaxID=121845 RepID=A0A1S4E9W4_DIACI|nr:phospholipase A2-like [Diaphorina citri]
MKSIRALPVSVLLIFVFISSVRSFDQSYYKNAYNHNKYNYLKGNNNNKYSNFNSNQDSYRSDKSDLIFPGTKWCGAGDIATDYNDLGTNVETDKCCRDHDHCSEYILAKSSLHGLRNNAPFTRVHCRCDKKFYDCLKTAADTGDQPSQMVGYMYFNLLETQCFQEVSLLLF